MHELSKQFRFDSAHTSDREIQAESSRRIHGHSYRAEVVIRGTPDRQSGMIVDLGEVERLFATTRDNLDHRLLDEINDLGPATIENLTSWIRGRLSSALPGLTRNTVYRDSAGESCTYYGPAGGSR